MLVPLSWLKDYVEITVSPEELARRLTFAGLEVENIQWIGLAPEHANINGRPDNPDYKGPRADGLAWDPEKIVVADVWEIAPHPNADRLVLCQLDDGQQVHTVLTGAPNLLHLKGQSRFETPIKVAYAREGTMLYDGHVDGWQMMTLKRAKIRGVDSYSMVCSEKELGISEEHEGIMILPADAPAAGTPLADYLGDVVFEVKINPNMARNTGMAPLAREIAALLGARFSPPSHEAVTDGPPIDGKVRIDIRHPDLNPRFTFTLIEGVTIGESPFWMQRRLRLAGMRPINNIVDITNYVMLETGQPLHAFDYDVLVQRAGGQAPTIITRLPHPGERLKTLDDVDRKLDDFTILVTDTAGALSLGGIMGGENGEVSASTTNVLLEVAAWNFINIRRSVSAQGLQSSQAGYRFSRGVHPALPPQVNWRAAELMRTLAGGVIAQGMVDDYPNPYPAVTVELPLARVTRLLGLEIPKADVLRILAALEFTVADHGDVLYVTAPPFRMDIGEGVNGVHDLTEEIARIYGYERLPETQIDDQIPQQHSNPTLVLENTLRDLMVSMGLQEAINYRLTAPDREARIYPGAVNPNPQPYVALLNPMVVERAVMRQSALASLLENVESNVRFRNRVALFEIGPVFLPIAGERLPTEPRRLGLVLAGVRDPLTWLPHAADLLDFFDLKGIVDAIVAGLHLPDPVITAVEQPSFRPGRTAQLTSAGQVVGVFGEIHPLVRENYAVPTTAPILAAEFDVEVLQAVVPSRFISAPVSRFPPIVEDIALVLDTAHPAATVEALIRQTGGALLVGVTLFDVFSGPQVGEGKVSLAYRLTYQADDRTLTDKEVAALRGKIVKRLERDLNATLRG